MSERLRYVLKKHDPFHAFSQIMENVLHVKDVRSYIYCKIESIGDENIHKDLGTICDNDLFLKFEYVFLYGLNLVKYMFYIEFDNHKQT